MRNARSRSTFKPRVRQRNSGQIVKKNSLIKGVTSSAINESYDSEVISWVSNVDANGGSVSQSTVESLNTFIRTIKSSSGLRDKIKRLNLFCGSNLAASLVPLISDIGNISDTNNNFTSSEYTKTTGLSNSTASGNKHVDTGMDLSDGDISFTDGHIAINTLGSNTSSTYKEWIGRDHATLGSNLGAVKQHHFRWGEHLLTTANTNPQEGTSMGFYLGNATSSKLSLYLNDHEKATKSITSNSPSNADLNQNFHVFKRNTIYSAPNDFDKTVNFYSIGKALTDAEVKVLYKAVAVFNQDLSREIYDAKDAEVWQWANHRLQESIGDVDTHFASSLVQTADKWMIDLKSYGLRNKISRVNLFLGSSSSSYAYLSSLVPLIIDEGNRTDVNNGFVNGDFNFTSGLKGNGTNKYLDTGVSLTRGHLLVNSTSSADNIISSPSTNTLIGALYNPNSADTRGLSLSLSTSKVASYVSDQSIDNALTSSEGEFLINAPSLNSQEFYFSGGLLGSKSVTIENISSAATTTITILALNRENSVTGYSNHSVNLYTIGESFTSDEVANLRATNSQIDRVTLSASNTEVYKWANETVPANGGDLTQREVDAADAWMTKIKSVSGLQDKIKRANLMVGSDLKTKLVPIVSTLGNEVDSSTSIEDENTNVKGVLGGADRKIETGLKLSELITDSAGHFSVQHARNFLPTDNAHGVITSDATKPNFGFKYTSSSLESYVFNSANPASFDLTSTAISSETITDNVVSSFSFSSGALNGPNIIYPYFATSTGVLNIKTDVTSVNYKYWSGDWNVWPAALPALIVDTYINETFVDSSLFNGVYRNEKTTYRLNWSVNVRKGDRLRVKIRRPSAPSNHRHSVELGSITAAYSSPVQEDISGLFTVSRESNTSLKLYANKVLKNTSTTAPSGSIVNRDDFVYLLGSYSDDGSLTNDFRGTSTELGFYSVGDGLTQAQVEGLNDAYTAFETALKRGLDEEAWDWGYNRVPNNGGTINDSDIETISTFMTSLKATSGLRESIRRLNIFAGSSLNSALVPLIKDAGETLETNYNFINTDINQGISSSAGKYLDLGTSLQDIPNGSFQNFHVSVSSKGTSLPATSTAYAIGDTSIKLDLNNSSAKINYASSSVTASSTGNGFWLASQESSDINLYKNGTSVGSGSADGAGSVTDNSFILFGNRTESGIASNFSGRISLYSIGVSLTSAQQSAFKDAVIALEESLKRGSYKAKNSDAWKWANVNVPSNSGEITQDQVDAVDKLMNSVSEIPHLRSSIKRMNLFVGENLNAALTPVIQDLGSASDINNNFISSDYTKDGLNAGLKGGLTKTLDTTVKASDVLKNSWNMSFRSPDGLTSTLNAGQPVMGAERGYNLCRIGHTSGYPQFGLAGYDFTSNFYKQPHVSNYRNPKSEYQGCEIISINPTPADEDTTEANCESKEGGVSAFSADAPTKSNRHYDFSYFNKTAGQSSNNNLNAFFPPAAAPNTQDYLKGFYSLLVNRNSSSVTTDFYKDGYKIIDASATGVESAPEDEVTLFGTKNNGGLIPLNGTITINFYCIGNGPVEQSTDNPVVDDENFSPSAMQPLLVELDKDLKRGGYYNEDASLTTITENLDPEVKNWANERVPKAGGKLNETVVKAADTFMKTIKGSSGLRNKIYRCNLFSADNLLGGLVPLINDEGFDVDLLKGDNKDEMNYSLADGANRLSFSNILAYIDTGFKATRNFNHNNGHISYSKSYKNTGSGGFLNGISQIISLDNAAGSGVGKIGFNFYCAGPNSSIWYNHRWGTNSPAAVNGYWRYVLSNDNTTSIYTYPSNNVFTLNQNAGTLENFLNGNLKPQNNVNSGARSPLPVNLSLLIFAEESTYDHLGRVADSEGGCIFPARSTITPVTIGSDTYMIALTDEEYFLENLTNPSGFSRTLNIEKYIKEKYGWAWDSLLYSDVESLWGVSDNNFQMGRLLDELNHGSKNDKPIGWLDIENSEGRANDSVATDLTRLLLHNNKNQKFNNYQEYSSNATSKTIVRNVNKYKTEKACEACGAAKTKAPILIKRKITDFASDQTGHGAGQISTPFNSGASNRAAITFYSIGEKLTTAEAKTLNDAYKAFATAIGRDVKADEGKLAL